MELKRGLVVSMRHYSRSELYKGVIIDSNFEFATIKFNEPFPLEVFHQGDPLTIGLEEDNLVYISSSSLITADPDNNKISVKVDTFEILSNKRLFERFPVSFDAALKIGSSKTEHQILVKNMSFNGMLATSQNDFPLYQEVKLDFFIGANVSLKAVIIRKSKEDHHYEYGLKLVYTDPSAPPVIKRFLNQLKIELETYVVPSSNVTEHSPT